jgi:Mg2+/Co2+ transporter CorC
MEISKSIQELEVEEYNKLIDISKQVTSMLVDLFTQKNSLTIQTANFAYCLGGLVFFRNVLEAINADSKMAPEIIKDCIDQIFGQMMEHEEKKNENVS